MSETKYSFAKLAGILKSAAALLKMQWNAGTSHPRLYDQFDPKDAQALFTQAASQLEILREQLPNLYGDFPRLLL